MSDIDYTSIACEYCGAPKGRGCMTRLGRATQPHDARTKPLIDAWRVGLRRGQECLLDEVSAWYERERQRLLDEQGVQL